MTKQRILKIATNEFANFGYDALSMSKLASKLEVNKATIYYHFKDKKSLYQEVILNLINDNQDKVNLLQTKQKDAKDKFREFISIVVNSFITTPQMVPIILREMANYGSNVGDSIIPALDADYNNLHAIISSLDLKDKYKTMDFHLIKSFILGTICIYYPMQMSNVKVESMKEFNKDPNEIFLYTQNFIIDILLDALCKD